jgi:hypothetical protein
MSHEMPSCFKMRWAEFVACAVKCLELRAQTHQRRHRHGRGQGVVSQDGSVAA